MSCLRELPYPYPIVIMFTNYGEISIMFSKQMRVFENDQAEYVQFLLKENFLELSLHKSDYGEVIVGKPFYEASYFDEVEESTPSRLLQKSDDSNKRFDDDAIYDKNFSWTIKNLTANRMKLQIIFDNPKHISADMFDKMQVAFIKPDIFLVDQFDITAPNDL